MGGEVGLRASMEVCTRGGRRSRPSEPQQGCASVKRIYTQPSADVARAQVERCGCWVRGVEGVCGGGGRESAHALQPRSRRATLPRGNKKRKRSDSGAKQSGAGSVSPSSLVLMSERGAWGEGGGGGETAAETRGPRTQPHLLVDVLHILLVIVIGAHGFAGPEKCPTGTCSGREIAGGQMVSWGVESHFLVFRGPHRA